MDVRISNLTIEHFRSLRKLTLEGLGRINLITGRNNTGKSSVLEALQIVASDASPLVIDRILRYREEIVGEPEAAPRLMDALAALFSGFPQFSENREPIRFAVNWGGNQPTLAISLDWFLRDTEGGLRKLIRQPQKLSEAEEIIPALVIDSGSGHRVVPLDRPRRFSALSRLGAPELAEEPRMPCVFVSPYGGEKTATLVGLWDKIALTDREADVVGALRIIAPNIEAVSMVGGEGLPRTAIVRASGFPRPIPLRSFGDGLNRLFGIVLSLVTAKDGLLLIDEFENGMHHTVQLDVWRAISRLARQLNVQVFATSHSWDAVETFQKVIGNDSTDGVLIRLSRRGETVIPTLFRADELAVATRDHIEVR